MKQLAKRLQSAREERAMSLRDLEKLLRSTGYEISHDSIRHYEKGDRTIPVEYVRNLARALDLDASWLLFGTEAGSGAEAGSEAEAGSGAKAGSEAEVGSEAETGD